MKVRVKNLVKNKTEFEVTDEAGEYYILGNSTNTPFMSAVKKSDAEVVEEKTYRLGQKFRLEGSISTSPYLLASMGSYKLGLINVDSGCRLSDGVEFFGDNQKIPEEVVRQLAGGTYRRVLVAVS